MLEQMMEESKHFLVRGKKHPYLGDEDPVFTRINSAAPNSNGAATCHCCSKPFKNLKAVCYWYAHTLQFFL